MKSQQTAAALSLQEELVAAIHGAFEVAVEIAVREVRKLVGPAAGRDYEEMRQENESLRKRLQVAEALLDSARTEGSGGGGSPPPGKLRFSAADPQLRLHFNPPGRELGAGGAHACARVGGDAAVAGRSRAQRRPDPRDELLGRSDEQGSGHVGTAQRVSGAAAEPETGREGGCSKEVPQHISPVGAIKVEDVSQPYQDPAAEDCNLLSLLGTDHKPTSEHVTVKQEKLEEESCLDSIKVEDFNLEFMSEVQSKMFEQWKPNVQDIQKQDPNSEMSCSRLTQASSSNRPSGLPPPSDLPSLSSDLSSFPLAEAAPISEAPPQVYGVHVRIRRTGSHNIVNHYACKSCGQNFPLPSLLRRHYGQCQQKRSQQPVAGSKRPRLQLYPPGCSPFRCKECNREFNRMENLKTHLRIHTGERPYTCSVCAKCFRHSGALKRHLRIHTGEKPYVCGQCGKSFRNCGGLKFHERVHSRQLQ